MLRFLSVPFQLSRSNRRRYVGVSGSILLPIVALCALVAVMTSSVRANQAVISDSVTLTVTKVLIPNDDDGRFAVHAGDATGAEAGHGAWITTSLAVSASVTIREAAGTATDLANYESSYVCDNGGPSGPGVSATFTLSDSNVSCTFTNVRKTRKLTVVKALEPVDDTGVFVMHAEGVAGEAGGDGATAVATVNVGASVVISETAGDGTDLAVYESSYACDGGSPSGIGASATFIMPDADTTCTFTNVRKTRKLTVEKALEPVSDAGRFVMHADGVAGEAGGDGASAVATADVGASVIVSETASAGTDLSDYRSSYVCDNGGTAGSGVETAFTMPDVDVTCVFTNVRTRTVTVTKALTPTNDDGLFVMHIGGVAGAEAGDGAVVATTVDVGAPVVISESAGAFSALGNYESSYACDTGGVSGTGTTAAFIAPNADVTCSFMNVRKTRVLTVTNALIPVVDSGLFVMHVDGVAGVQGGSGAVVTSTVDVGGSVVVRETAGTLTDLANYTTIYGCDQGGPAGNGTTAGLTMPDADMTCTFTNTRKIKTLLVVNALAPASDPGRFIMEANGVLGAEAGAGAASSTTVPVGSVATFGELVGAGTSLAAYRTDFSCSDPAKTSGSGVYGYLTMPDQDVTCTMFNLARSAADLELQKLFAPTGEVAVSEPFTVTFIVDNLGPAVATNVTVSNTLFSGRAFTLLGVRDDRDACAVAAQSGSRLGFECAAARLGVNARWSISVRVVADTPMDIHSVARVYNNDQADPVTANNSDTVSIRVVDGIEVADLKLQNFVVPNGVTPPEAPFTYTLVVDNLGPAIATNVVVNNTLFGNGLFTLKSVDDDRDACSVASKSGVQMGFDCTLAELGLNQRWTIYVQAVADAAMDIHSEARVFNDDQIDPIIANNSSVVTMRVLDGVPINRLFLPMVVR